MSRKRASKKPVSAARHAADFVVLGLTLVVAWFLWPSFLGGSSRMITVQGKSMEPTYEAGDLVLLDTSATPEIGRIVVFKIPADEPGSGSLVVHRIIGRRGDGTYITQGDNADNPDTFHTTRSDILGSPRFAVAHGGQVISLLTSPIGLAGATGMLSTVMLWPRKRREITPEVTAVTERPVAATADLPEPAADDNRDFDAEAAAWLQEELALLALERECDLAHVH